MCIKNANIDVQKIIKLSVEYIKDTFNLRSKAIVGIDIGASAVKVAELVKIHGDNYKLIRYASVPLSEGAIMDDEIIKEDELLHAVKTACLQAKITAEVACLGLSGHGTAVKKLQLAAGTDEDIEDQIFWEAEQYISFPPEDASIAFHKLGMNEGGGVDVILAAAKNEVIQRFVSLIHKTELKVKVVDLNLIALLNVFEHTLKEQLLEKELSYIIFEIGAQKTHFIIYKNQSMIFSKEINFGGMMITEEIQRRLAVNFVQAEELKIQADENGNLPENITKIIEEMLEAFYAEIKKSLEFYLKTSSNDNFVRCYLTGGSAGISGLIEGLHELLDIEVELLNPFSKFEYDPRHISEEQIPHIALTGSNVLGLAMREWRK